MLFYSAVASTQSEGKLIKSQVCGVIKVNTTSINGYSIAADAYFKEAILLSSLSVIHLPEEEASSRRDRYCRKIDIMADKRLNQEQLAEVFKFMAKTAKPETNVPENTKSTQTQKETKAAPKGEGTITLAVFKETCDYIMQEEQKRREATIKQYEERFRAAFEEQRCRHTNNEEKLLRTVESYQNEMQEFARKAEEIAKLLTYSEAEIVRLRTKYLAKRKTSVRLPKANALISEMKNFRSRMK
jgi:hypothetical protein